MRSEFKYLFIYIFLALLAGSLPLRGLFSNCDQRGLLFIAVLGLLIEVPLGCVSSVVVAAGLWHTG